MTVYENWGIRKFARHWVKTRQSKTGISPIFGTSDRIYFMAVVKYGRTEADRVFKEEIAKAERKK